MCSPVIPNVCSYQTGKAADFVCERKVHIWKVHTEMFFMISLSTIWYHWTTHQETTSLLQGFIKNIIVQIEEVMMKYDIKLMYSTRKRSTKGVTKKMMLFTFFCNFLTDGFQQKVNTTKGRQSPWLRFVKLLVTRYVRVTLSMLLEFSLSSDLIIWI